jgi:hypothetical protein
MSNWLEIGGVNLLDFWSAGVIVFILILWGVLAICKHRFRAWVVPTFCALAIAANAGTYFLMDTGFAFGGDSDQAGAGRRDAPVTRADFARFVVEMFEDPDDTLDIFDDVPANSRDNRWVAAAVRLGIIIPGEYGASLGADEPITRDEAAVWMLRAIRAAGDENGPASAPRDGITFEDEVDAAMQMGLYDILFPDEVPLAEAPVFRVNAEALIKFVSENLEELVVLAGTGFGTVPEPDEPGEPEEPEDPGDPQDEGEPPLVEYIITTSVNDGLAGTAEAQPPAAEQGTLVEIRAIASEGFEFDYWEVVSGNVRLKDASEPSESFEMPGSDVSLRAHFRAVHVPVYSITMSENNASYGNARTGQPQAEQGVEVSITATSNSGYEFERWEVVSGGVALSNDRNRNASFTMPFR